MADNLKKQPKKGILKNSSSFETEERQRELNKGGAKWDEMNILATHHPKDKDYGHMKIEEPKTPYAYHADDSGDEADGIDANLLAEKIALGGCKGPKALDNSPDESSEEEEETQEERAKRKAFEMKRKHHYNEFAAVKLARKLMQQDDDDDDEDDDDDDDSVQQTKLEEVHEEDEEEEETSSSKREGKGERTS